MTHECGSKREQEWEASRQRQTASLSDTRHREVNTPIMADWPQWQLTAHLRLNSTGSGSNVTENCSTLTQASSQNAPAEHLKVWYKVPHDGWDQGFVSDKLYTKHSGEFLPHNHNTLVCVQCKNISLELCKTFVILTSSISIKDLCFPLEPTGPSSWSHLTNCNHWSAWNDLFLNLHTFTICNADSLPGNDFSFQK